MATRKNTKQTVAKPVVKFTELEVIYNSAEADKHVEKSLTALMEYFGFELESAENLDHDHCNLIFVKKAG